MPAFPKPRRGAYELERKARKAELRTQEAANKVRSKARDGKACRAPHATYTEYLECKRLRIESGHLTHKGMGSDPTGERSVTDLLVTLGMRCHRERLDGKTLRVKFLTADRADGVLAWEEQRDEGWTLTHVEQRIGDANDRWRQVRR